MATTASVSPNGGGQRWHLAVRREAPTRTFVWKQAELDRLPAAAWTCEDGVPEVFALTDRDDCQGLNHFWEFGDVDELETRRPKVYRFSLYRLWER